MNPFSETDQAGQSYKREERDSKPTRGAPSAGWAFLCLPVYQKTCLWPNGAASDVAFLAALLFRFVVAVAPCLPARVSRSFLFPPAGRDK